MHNEICIITVPYTECWEYCTFYMTLFFLTMLCFQVDMDDIFNSAEHFVFPEACDNTSPILPTLTDTDVPETKKGTSVSIN